MAQWFYTKDGQDQVGPVSSKELKRLVEKGVIGRDDLLLKEGMDRWVRGRQVKGLFEGSGTVKAGVGSEPSAEESTDGAPARKDPSSSDHHCVSPKRTGSAKDQETNAELDSHWWQDPILRIAVIVPTVILLAFGGYLARERSHRVFQERIQSLKREADLLAASGKKQDALQKYSELIAYAGKNDPGEGLRTELAEARSLRNRLDATLAAEAEAARKKQEKARERQEAERLALEEFNRAQAEARKKEEEEGRSKREEQERQEKKRVNLSGGAWIARQNGESDLLRGVNIYVLKCEIPFKEIEFYLSVNVRKFEKAAEAYERMARNTAPSLQQLAEGDRAVAKALRRDANSLKTYIASHRADDIINPKEAIDNLRRVPSYPSGIVKAIVSDDPWQKVFPLILVTKTSTGIDGRYHMPELKFQPYFVYARFTTSRSFAEWCHYVVVPDEGDWEVDFNNENADRILNN